MIFVLFLLTPTERDYVEALAAQMPGAETEVVLWDSTRCDIVWSNIAYEVDYAPKWAEAIGQSLYYADVLNMKPGIILLVKDLRKEKQFIYRCQTVCNKRGIILSIVETKDVILGHGNLRFSRPNDFDSVSIRRQSNSFTRSVARADN